MIESATHFQIAMGEGTLREERGDIPPEKILDDLFRQFNWHGGSPPKDIAGVIRKLELHSSMSVGDVIALDDRFYVCATSGWAVLETIQLGDESRPGTFKQMKEKEPA
jgi:hypothetical protein